MPNLNLNTFVNRFLPVLIATQIIFWNYSCGSDKSSGSGNSTNTGYSCEYPNNPVMVVIGEDLSGSFARELSLQVETIQSICEIISKNGRGGKVVVGTVGDPTPKGYVICEIKPLPRAPKHATLAGIAFCKKEASKTMAENASAIDAFTDKCAALLSSKGHKTTDINGFFRKINTISSQPGSSDYDIWVFINSDGKQDAPGQNKLDCTLKPDNIRFYVSNWTETTDCGADGKFLNPEQFVNFFKNQL